MVRIEGLTKHYGSIRALDHVTFDVRRGEVLGLIGPNGSGKTTLFECVGGTLSFDGGSVRADPRELFYLADTIAPYPGQTVRWVLDFIAGYFGASSTLRDIVIERLSVAPLLDTRIGELSKGQRKRAMLAIGFLTSRPVLLADEPFDGLDLKQTRDVAAALRSFAQDGRTLVLSIHQISDAARVCDRFVLLSGGTVRGVGTIAELRAVAERTLGTPGTPGTLETLEEVFLALT